MPAAANGIVDREETARHLPPYASGTEHLLAELERLRLFLHREVLYLRASGFFTEDRFRGLYVSDELVDAVLRQRYAKRPEVAADENSAATMAILSRAIEAAGGEIAGRIESSLAAGVFLPLVHLTETFSLLPFERDALVACAAVEVDLRFETLFSYAQNDVTRKCPTPDLLLRLFGRSHEESLRQRGAFSAGGNLLSHPLVRFAENTPDREHTLLGRAMRAEERIVSFLLGQSEIDSRLHSFVSCRSLFRTLTELRLPRQLLQELTNAAREKNGTGILCLCGPAGAGKKSVAGALSAQMGRPLLIADLRRAETLDPSWPTILSLLQREASLCGANLCLDHAEVLAGDEAGQLHRRAAPLECLKPAPHLVFINAESPWLDHDAAPGEAWSFDLPVPGFSDRTHIWEQAALETGSIAGHDHTNVLAGKFALTAGEIHASCRDAARRATLRGDDTPSLDDFEAAARRQSNQSLRRLARKIDCLSDWSELVLPARTIRQLRDICSAQRYRPLVFSEWGFDRGLRLGKGLSVLFHGQSGTGKTAASGIIARELGLDLYKIDLSTVVSKYIGETEKQLSRIFREAQSSNAILFFDEADALFGKRSEVKEAHDRFANIEVAYLLQRMEEYEGIVILATNFRKNLDDAFTRRLQHIVEFPFPDAEHRERIWKVHVPPQAPIANDVNFAFLARQFEFAGGNIRNAVLAAAFLAAEENGVIGMKHLVVATARELQKLGKLPGRAEFREYFELTQNYS